MKCLGESGTLLQHYLCWVHGLYDLRLLSKMVGDVGVQRSDDAFTYKTVAHSFCQGVPKDEGLELFN